jgi:hypothetical protein
MINPGTNKFRSGYKKPFDQHLDHANQAIDRAARYLIVGYGFNDDHLEEHLSSEIKKGKPTLILSRSLPTRAHTLIQNNRSSVALSKPTNSDETAYTRVTTHEQDILVSPGRLWDLSTFTSEFLKQ